MNIPLCSKTNIDVALEKGLSKRAFHSNDNIELPIPVGSVDCHFHVFSDLFAIAPYARLRPPPASLEAYHAMQNQLGLCRAVLVQPSTYGTDNQPYLHLMQILGTQNYRMIAVVNPTITDTELSHMHNRGVRGIRFNLAQAGATSLNMLETLSQRVHEFGWHCQIHFPENVLIEAHSLLSRIKGTLVFDHIGRIEQPRGIDRISYRIMRSLIDKGNVWVKISAPYIDSQSGAPDYQDVGTVARSLIRAAPERMVWGSDWPHATEPDTNKPDAGNILQLLAAWAGNKQTLNQILVKNPEYLYGFHL